jgi:hypothetical protein
MTGMINPMMPLINAFLDGGDSVTVASPAAAAEIVAHGCAATFAAVGSGADEWFGQLAARTRGAPGDGIPPDRISHYFFPRLFGEIATGDMIDDVLSVGRTFAPDVVMFETGAFAGALAAAVLGVPGVYHQVAALPDTEVLELVNDALSPMWRSFGVDPVGYAGVYAGLTLGICPPSLERLRVPAGELVPLRPAPLPSDAGGRGERPLVYVTLGTFMNANPGFFRTVLDGLAGDSVDVIATVGADQDPSGLGPVPSNARVERFIPQASLLPTCSAVVHHGGAGTMFGALAHGLPQVIVPQGADNFLNASMIEDAGAGLTALPEGVASAIRRVLDEPGFASAAQRLAAEIAAMPSAAAVAADLRARFG